MGSNKSIIAGIKVYFILTELGHFIMFTPVGRMPSIAFTLSGTHPRCSDRKLIPSMFLYVAPSLCAFYLLDST